MRRIIYRIFLWSWLVTLPISLIGGYLAFRTIERYYTFFVRLDTHKYPIASLAQYELESAINRFRIGLTGRRNFRTDLRVVNLYIPEANISLLEEHMPQSGFNYVKARILVNDDLVKAKIRYRGDSFLHWAWDKKSIRVKTDKKHLFNGMRRFNLQAPKHDNQLINFLSYKLAEQMDVLAPRTELVRLFINNKDQGVSVLVEQLGEETLRYRRFMPADIYRGEIFLKDAYQDSGISTLFESAAVWDKVAVNNHYDESEKKSLESLVDLLKDIGDPASQDALSELLDIEAWARFSVFETLAQTKHICPTHNWRLYYDPWRQKMVPIAWDPMGWHAPWLPKPGEKAFNASIVTKVSKALFRNGDFLRARDRIFRDFFASGEDEKFLKFVSDTVSTMQNEVLSDPNLRPANPALVSNSMSKLESAIQGVFSDLRHHYYSSDATTLYRMDKGEMELWLYGHRAVKRVRIDFDHILERLPAALIRYNSEENEKVVDVSGAVQLQKNSLILDKLFLPELKIIGEQLSSFPARYTIEIEGLEQKRVVGVSVDVGEGWKLIDETSQKKGVQLIENKIISEKNDLRAKLPHDWQVFWDAGKGFREADTAHSITLRRDKGPRWRIKRYVGRTFSALRIDPPFIQNLHLRDILLESNGEKIKVPLSEVTMRNMQREGEWIKSVGNPDPNFTINTQRYLHEEEPTSFNISFELKVVTPSERTLAEGSVGDIESIHSPVEEEPLSVPVVWDGDISISDTITINKSLIIKPGTRLLMGPGGTLVVKGPLFIEGTKEAPVKILPADPSQEPWGAIVIIDPGANGSRIEHCYMSGGSGVKQDLFEYTGMLSIHNVAAVQLNDCFFSDNKIVDDMVHVVYSEVEFNRCEFLNANSDALDIDISKAKIVDSTFRDSGNDAIDLMTAEAFVSGSLMIKNGDKGISVGEGSSLLAVNNQLMENAIGVQAKDSSVAVLVNHTFKNNTRALHVYKKNWRYGKGGQILATKSHLSGNGESVKADKGSSIRLFDSYVDQSFSSKRITASVVDQAKISKAKRSAFLPKGEVLPENVTGLLEGFQKELAKSQDLKRRGAVIER
jgi:hypothetical protein